MSRIAAVLALIAGLLLIPVHPAAADPAGDEAEFLDLVNQLRAEKGVGPLSVDAHLTSVARSWSAHMADDGQLSHNPNLGSDAGGGWQMLGENVGYGGTVKQIHDAFVNSPHHYENLVEPRFSLVGIGVVVRDGTIWVTEDFEQPRAAKPRPSPPPTAAKPAAPRPAPAATRTQPARASVGRAPAAAARPVAPAATVPPATTTTVPPSTTTTAIPIDVAGRHYDRPAPLDMVGGDVQRASVVFFGILLLAAAAPLARALRSRVVDGRGTEA
jgi:hypothetical protein